MVFRHNFFTLDTICTNAIKIKIDLLNAYVHLTHVHLVISRSASIYFYKMKC